MFDLNIICAFGRVFCQKDLSWRMFLTNMHTHRGRGEIGRRTGFRFQRRKV